MPIRIEVHPYLKFLSVLEAFFIRGGRFFYPCWKLDELNVFGHFLPNRAFLFNFWHFLAILEIEN